MNTERAYLLLLFIFSIISVNCADKIPGSKHTVITNKDNMNGKPDNAKKDKKEKGPPSPYGSKSEIVFDSTKTATGGEIELLLFSYPGAVIVLPLKTKKGETASQVALKFARKINKPSGLYYADEGKGKILANPSRKDTKIHMMHRPVSREYKDLHLIAKAEKATVKIKNLGGGEYAIRGTEKGIIGIHSPPEFFKAIIDQDKSQVVLTWKNPDKIDYDGIYIVRNSTCLPHSNFRFPGKRTSYTDDISRRNWKEWLVYAVVGIKNGIPSAAFLTLED